MYFFIKARSGETERRYDYEGKNGEKGPVLSILLQLFRFRPLLSDETELVLGVS